MLKQFKKYLTLEFPDRAGDPESKREYVVGFVLYSLAGVLAASLLLTGILAMRRRGAINAYRPCHRQALVSAWGKRDRASVKSCADGLSSRAPGEGSLSVRHTYRDIGPSRRLRIRLPDRPVIQAGRDSPNQVRGRLSAAVQPPARRAVRRVSTDARF